MTRQRKTRRLPVDGVLLLNKPHGLSSNQALQRVKRHLNAAKAGHTGSLDPAATGMLPLCFGEATKASAFLLEADKCYRVEARLGAQTDSGDATGAVIAESAVPELTDERWEEILASFVGQGTQIPPMYSALKKDGKRLYELARRGEVVDRKPRAICIHRIEHLEAHGARLVFRVWCSKGTYIRTLVEDIAHAAGCVAHTRNLHRESVNPFGDLPMLDLAEIEAMPAGDVMSALLAPDVALKTMPAIELSEEESERFLQGQRLGGKTADAKGFVRVYSPAGVFLGVAELEESQRLSPKRIFSASAANQPPPTKKREESLDFHANS
jgi:tRNA pseudouridine55 synthase